ncbi:hypothetical protein TNCV_3511891 [Trichonephila clavipes]|nr:hypothetical protein TNCV_3511891 [Trichonephila clavipes]
MRFKYDRDSDLAVMFLRIAQSVEHETRNLGVVGSYPTLGAIVMFPSLGEYLSESQRELEERKVVIMALYRSPLTVTLWPSLFLKKYGPIPPAHKSHQTVSFSDVTVFRHTLVD